MATGSGKPTGGRSPLDGLLDLASEAIDALTALPRDIAEGMANAFNAGRAARDPNLAGAASAVRAQGGLGTRGEAEAFAREMSRALAALMASPTNRRSDRLNLARPIAETFAPKASPLGREVLSRDLAGALGRMRQAEMGREKGGAKFGRRAFSQAMSLMPDPVAKGFAAALQKSRGWNELGRSFEGMARSSRGLSAALPALRGASLASSGLGLAIGAPAALIETLKSLRDSANRQTQQVERLALVNAPIAAASMRLQLGDYSRMMARGRATERTGAALVDATNAMRSALSPFGETYENLFNQLNQAGAGVVRQAADEAAPWLDWGKLKAKQGIDGLAGLAGEALGRAVGLPPGVAKALGIEAAKQEGPNAGEIGAGAVGGIAGLLDGQGFFKGMDDAREGQQRAVEEARNNFNQGWAAELWAIGGAPHRDRANFRAPGLVNGPRGGPAGAVHRVRPQFRTRREKLQWLQQNMDPAALNGVVQFNLRNAEGANLGANGLGGGGVGD